MPQDLTPEYDIVPAKDKVVPGDIPFGQNVGGTKANSGSVKSSTTSGARVEIFENDIDIYDASVGGTSPVTGNTARINFIRSDDEVTMYTLQKRASVNSDADNVLELSATAAPSNRYNYLFLGRKGDQSTGTDWNIHSFNNAVDLKSNEAASVANGIWRVDVSTNNTNVQTPLILGDSRTISPGVSGISALLLGLSGVGLVATKGNGGGTNFAGLGFQPTATITNISLSSNVVTVTCSNSFIAGFQVILTGLTTSTYLNGQTLTVSSASSTQFTAAFTHSNEASHSDTGTATSTAVLSGLYMMNGNTVSLGLDLIPDADNSYDIGSASARINDIFIGGAAHGVNVESYTTGEAITAGQFVCIKPSSTDIVSTDADAYVYSAQATTNFGDEIQMFVGTTASGTYRSFIKFDLSTLNSAQDILKAELRLVRNIFVGGSKDINLERVSGADWSEGTITWNNQPATTDDIDGVYGMENQKVSGLSPTTMTWDITQLVRHWKDGNVNNYGIMINATTGGGDDNMSFKTSENATSNDRARLRVYTGNSSDGKIYKANCNDYTLCRCIIGVALESASEGASCKVQLLGEVDSLSGLSIGRKLLLSNTSGAAVTSPAGLERVIMLGKTTATTKAILGIEHTGIFIEKLYAGLSTTTGIRRFYAPVDARFARIYTYTGSASKTVVDIYRDGDGLDTFEVGPTGSDTVTYTWGSNYVEVDGGSTSTIINDVQFYT